MDTSSVCIANIGPNQRRRRVIMGVVMALLTFVAAAWLVAADVPRSWRLLVFIPAWIGALDFFQVRARTCVLLAARGVRNLDRGEEAIGSADDLASVRAQARTVHMQSALAASVVTIIVLFA